MCTVMAVCKCTCINNTQQYQIIYQHAVALRGKINRYQLCI